jgi:hypothetical protein
MTRVETTKEAMFEVEVHRRIQFWRQQRDGSTFRHLPRLTQRKPLARFGLGRHPQGRLHRRRMQRLGNHCSIAV